jgi:hypothetical protein
MPKKPPGRIEHLRAAIAQEAARIMAEGGIQDFGLAKRKAAERYGVHEDGVLPRNVEIEAALFERQRLFGNGEHERSLSRQRGAAVAAMELLEKFEPRLVGPVLTGSATEYSDVQLHVFAEPAENVYFLMMDRRVEHEVGEKKVKMQSDRQLTLPSVRFAIEDDAVEVVIFPKDGIRQSPVSPVDGKPMRRADLDDVQRLLADAPLSAILQV